MFRRIPRRIRRWMLASGVCLTGSAMVVFVVLWCCFRFPADRLNSLPVSPRVTDRSGQVLLQVVGEDDHWRFPVALDEMSPWLIQATIAAEDERFDTHAGVDPIAVVRASLQNLKSQQVVSGASTLTMQLCRMLDPRPRSLSAKLIESVRSLQAEQILSKSEILEHYLNLAPYGGNIRGVEAAARRYFGRSCRDLSLGQAALLAGLPQAPSRFRPDRFPEAALRRRKYVLSRMVTTGVIFALQEKRALAEPVASPLRSESDFAVAPHAAWLALRKRPSGGQTTIDTTLQQSVEDEVSKHSESLPASSDIAVVVIDIESSEIRALVGSSNPRDPVDGQNNGVIARRSPGSALKPFLYAAAFESRRLNADCRIPDTPLDRGGWKPDNFDRSFRGSMTVAEALRESRNVPAIRVTEAIGLQRCIGVIQSCGVQIPPEAGRIGGLSLAVGGVETTLLDLTNAYATLGRNGDCRPPRLFSDDVAVTHRALSARTCRSLNEILSSRHRCPYGLETVSPESIPWFMWKTGTSSGRRDAWAVGHNGRVAIGVWVGRFSGGGHPDFVGRTAAEPLLVSLFSLRSVRIDRVPSSPPPIPVTRPLKFEFRDSEGPRIVSPGREAEFLCLENGLATVPVEFRSSDDLTWFLNQRTLDLAELRTLKLQRGHYELRCVEKNGRSDAARFSVR